MTSQQPLFDRSEFVQSEALADEGMPIGKPRLRCASRDQVIMHCEALDDLIPAEHVARSIWAYVAQLDLSPLLAQIKAVEGHEGRSMTDPRILLTLWLYATVEGIGSARELARLCEVHAVYKWIAGGVSLNYHTLADFRALQGTLLDKLLTQSVTTLMSAGVVDLQRVAQDGMRVRANAGGNTFRRRSKLENCLAEAQEQVQRLKAEMDGDPAACRKRIQAARQRAAEERGVVVSVSASGGARMQEGILALMQLPKTVAAVGELQDSGGALLSVLAHPTTGGVTASFASLGDVILAEPGALTSFAGPRVVAQTTREKLPDDFGLAESNLRFGHVDAVVPRAELRSTLARLLRLFGART